MATKLVTIPKREDIHNIKKDYVSLWNCELRFSIVFICGIGWAGYFSKYHYAYEELTVVSSSTG